MTNTQEELLKLFKEIADICHRNDIVYYMAGGTLIGLIRHKGFIPWDDDLDIMMTRNNWLKFVDACKREMPEGRALECQELNRDYPNVIGRYTDLNTTAIHDNEILGDGSAGYVIDIIALDPVPDEAAHRQYLEDLLLYSDLVNTVTQYSYRLGINKDRYSEYMDRIQKEGREPVLRELEDRMFSYDEDECDYLVLRWGGVPFLFDKTLYGSSRWGEFEGVRCRIPDRTSDYLVQHFGDEWTTIPPHSEQASHNAVFTTEIDYKTMQADYLHFLDADSIRQDWLKRKKFYFERMDDRIYATYMKCKARAEMYSMEINARIKGNEQTILQLLEENRFDVLSEFFEEYFAHQNGREMIGREDFSGFQRFQKPVFIEIPDDMFNAAMVTLINTNRISKADRFIEVREIIKGTLSEDLLKTHGLIDQFRAIISAYDAGEREKSLRLAEEMYCENPEMLSLEMFLVRTYTELGKYEQAKAIIDKALEKYPEDGFFMKYLGDYHRLYLNDPQAAEDLYREAYFLTNNGIALLEIEEIVGKIEREDEDSEEMIEYEDSDE